MSASQIPTEDLRSAVWGWNVDSGNWREWHATYRLLIERAHRDWAVIEEEYTARGEPMPEKDKYGLYRW